MVFDSLWRGLTRAGALAGFWGGAISFILIHGQIISGQWLSGTTLEGAGNWFDYYATSPYSAATLGGLISVALCFFVSKFTAPLPQDHLNRVSQGG